MKKITIFLTLLAMLSCKKSGTDATPCYISVEYLGNTKCVNPVGYYGVNLFKTDYWILQDDTDKGIKEFISFQVKNFGNLGTYYTNNVNSRYDDILMNYRIKTPASPYEDIYSISSGTGVFIVTKFEGKTITGTFEGTLLHVNTKKPITIRFTMTNFPYN